MAEHVLQPDPGARVTAQARAQQLRALGRHVAAAAGEEAAGPGKDLVLGLEGDVSEEDVVEQHAQGPHRGLLVQVAANQIDIRYTVYTV